MWPRLKRRVFLSRLSSRGADGLPAPKDRFILMLRLYWPREKDPSILDGTWKPPAVKLSK